VSETLVIPAAPATVQLEIGCRWDGMALGEAERGAHVRLAAERDALWVEAVGRHAAAPRIPAAPPGSRVPGLWHHDVVECFLLAADGRYLELELGAGGHYLALAFDAPRRRRDDFARHTLDVAWQRDAGGWVARCRVPRAWVPEPVTGANAFAIADGDHRAHAPVGGSEPDFHRTDGYPRARIPSWE